MPFISAHVALLSSESLIRMCVVAVILRIFIIIKVKRCLNWKTGQNLSAQMRQIFLHSGSGQEQPVNDKQHMCPRCLIMYVMCC